LAVKSGSNITIFSRLRKSLKIKFPYIVEPLADLPEGMGSGWRIGRHRWEQSLYSDIPPR
jgi:hypothetical protein